MAVILIVAGMDSVNATRTPSAFLAQTLTVQVRQVLNISYANCSVATS